jgi:hypothetical protein
LKIENFGKFVSRPQIKTEYTTGAMKPTVTISGESGNSIFYTTDGSEPDTESFLYKGPFNLDKSSAVKAISTIGPFPILRSLTATSDIKVYEWKKAIKVSNVQPGIFYKYFEPSGKIDISSVNTNKLTTTGITTVFSLTKKNRADKFAFEFSGYLKIDKDGIYTFFIESDDGSKLFIDDEEIIDNDGDHGNVEKNGRALLKKGLHKIRVVYFDSGGGNLLRVSIQPEGEPKKEIPASLLYH